MSVLHIVAWAVIAAAWLGGALTVWLVAVEDNDSPSSRRWAVVAALLWPAILVALVLSFVLGEDGSRDDARFHVDD